MREYLRIGELAKRTGTSVQTLRYYEAEGLIRSHFRSRSGYRYFEPETETIIKFIRCFKDMGFTLKEIMDLTEMISRGGNKSVDYLGVLEKKCCEVKGKMESMQSAYIKLCERKELVENKKGNNLCASVSDSHDIESILKKQKPKKK